MVPFGEQHAQRCNKSQWLIKHDMVAGVGDRDIWHLMAKQFTHMRADIIGHQSTFFSANDRNPAADGAQHV